MVARRAEQRRRWIMILELLGLSYVAWCAAAYILQDRVVFPGGFRGIAGLANFKSKPPPDAESLWVNDENGVRVEGWFLPARGRGSASPGPAVIYVHGNGELIDFWPAALDPYRQLGVSVLLPEYRGYGRSLGRPSERSVIADMERFHDWLAARPEVDRQRIVFHGRSLGGAVAAALATRRRPAALILESTFISIESFFKRFAIPPFLCRHPFRTDVALAKIDAPALIVHGSRDEIVPVMHGRYLAAIARGSRYVEFDAGHNDLPPDPYQYWQVIRDFLLAAGVLD